MFQRMYSSGSQFILKPAPPQEWKIIFAPLAPFDVLFFVLSEKFAQRRSHPKKYLLAPPEGANTPNWEPLMYRIREVKFQNKKKSWKCPFLESNNFVAFLNIFCFEYLDSGRWSAWNCQWKKTSRIMPGLWRYWMMWRCNVSYYASVEILIFLDQLPHGLLHNWINIFRSADDYSGNYCYTFVTIRGKFASIV